MQVTLNPARSHGLILTFVLFISGLGFSLQSAGQGVALDDTISPPPENSSSESLEAPRPRPEGSLTLGERLSLTVHRTFGPTAFIYPAAEAGIVMAAPPHKYPSDWLDGGGAFGRNYGAQFARHAAGNFTQFAVATVDREDPRYFPSTSTNVFARTMHALAFTVVDRSNTGHRTLAISNFAGAASAGAVGMAFYPDGFNDTIHAYQRAAVEFGSYGSYNLTAEFSPEIVRLLRKCHVPDGLANSFLPAGTNRR